MKHCKCGRPMPENRKVPICRTCNGAKQKAFRRKTGGKTLGEMFPKLMKNKSKNWAY